MIKIHPPNQKTVVLGLVLLGLIGSFYWWEWRPAEIKKECRDFAFTVFQNKDTSSGKTEAYDFLFKDCLHRNGL